MSDEDETQQQKLTIIQLHNRIVGVIAFEYQNHPFKPCVKKFTLLSFYYQLQISPKPEDNWYTVLAESVKKIHLTDLYVIGYNKANYLEKVLHINLIPLKNFSRRRLKRCLKCGKLTCCVEKAKDMFSYIFSYYIPIRCSGK